MRLANQARKNNNNLLLGLAAAVCGVAAGLMYFLSFHMFANTQWFVLLCLGVAIGVPIGAWKLGHTVLFWKGLAITELIISVSHLLGFAGYALATGVIEHSDFESVRFAGVYWIVALLVGVAGYAIGYAACKSSNAR